MTTWTSSASESSARSKPSSSASCWSATGPAAPRSRLADRQPAVVERDRPARASPPRRRGRRPARKPPSASQKRVDLLGDEALVERLARTVDLLLAGAAAALARRSAGTSRRVPGCGRARRAFGARQVELGRSGPGREQLAVQLDRRGDALVQRIAELRVPDRELEHVPEPPRPELAEQEQPAAERAGHARGEHAGAGDELVAELAEALDRRGRRRDALAAERRAARRARRVQKTAGTSPPGPFRCGSTTWRTKPVAHAASKALPPRSSTDIPAAEASQCVDATIPKVPRSSGRVVNVTRRNLRGLRAACSARRRVALFEVRRRLRTCRPARTAARRIPRCAVLQRVRRCARRGRAARARSAGSCPSSSSTSSASRRRPRSSTPRTCARS